jgi:hypothetical protein
MLGKGKLFLPVKAVIRKKIGKKRRRLCSGYFKS